MMTPQEVLNTAADIIAARGHGKQHYEDAVTGNVCAYGAMTAAATDGTDGRTADYSVMNVYGTPRAKRLVDQAARLLATHLRGPLDGYADEFDIVTHFNDADTTDGPTLIRHMKEAATVAAVVVPESAPAVV
ncbi:hypothetical protein ACFWPU_00770 [Streptomyces sp. NPDC058471]|uniref:DUF6197 family protein n=1 Tax=Streptomyces sp. NPDC058471 TaxID=3346516 RepID=UPI0036481889